MLTSGSQWSRTKTTGDWSTEWSAAVTVSKSTPVKNNALRNMHNMPSLVVGRNDIIHNDLPECTYSNPFWSWNTLFRHFKRSDDNKYSPSTFHLCSISFDPSHRSHNRKPVRSTNQWWHMRDCWTVVYCQSGIGWRPLLRVLIGRVLTSAQLFGYWRRDSSCRDALSADIVMAATMM